MGEREGERERGARTWLLPQLQHAAAAAAEIALQLSGLGAGRRWPLLLEAWIGPRFLLGSICDKNLSGCILGEWPAPVREFFGDSFRRTSAGRMALLCQGGIAGGGGT